MYGRLDSLFEERRNKLYFQLMIRTKHFEHAYIGHVVEGSRRPTEQEIPGFYADVLLRMISDWSTATRDNPIPQIEHALTEIGLDANVISRWNAILDGPIGELTWRQVIRKYRNRPGTHAIFVLDSQQAIADAAGVEPSTLPSALSEVLNQLFDQVKEIRRLVRESMEEESSQFASFVKQMPFYYDFEVT